ncbi:MAG: helix-turn-helix domain-containing protein [Candidatus Competibacteraceae bacterium]|nr:helix-turn-helix domain-containing protein [Candidatus Competibacteraceae bacterium]
MLIVHRIQLFPNNKQRGYFRRVSGVARFCFHWVLVEWPRQRVREVCPTRLLSGQRSPDRQRDILIHSRPGSGFSRFQDSVRIADHLAQPIISFHGRYSARHNRYSWMSINGVAHEIQKKQLTFYFLSKFR